MSSSGIRVVIVDQHELVRVGLRAVLEARVLTNVVGEAATAADGVALCRETQPDVVVTGMPLRGATGCEHVTQFRAASPRTAVIVVTTVDEPDGVLAAVRAGAAGYLLDDGSSGDLLDVIDRVVGGGSYVDPRVVAGVIRSVAGGPGGTAIPAPAPLTPRELEVLRQVARGSANKEIAHELRMAAGTVKVHVEHILAKLGAANRVDASIRAVRLGLLDVAEADPPSEAGDRHYAPGEAAAH